MYRELNGGMYFGEKTTNEAGTYASDLCEYNEDEIAKFNFNITVNVNDIGVIADSGGMQIVLRNLIENAIKFSKSVPNPEIIIGLEEYTESWILSVKDNGVGFDYESKKKKSFGLSNIHNRILEINGILNVESSKENGTSYVIQIQLYSW